MSSVKKQKVSEYTNTYTDIWKRPELPSEYLNTSNPIALQNLEIDHYVKNSLPIIRIYGVSQLGFSVCIHVHEFKPYLFVDCPQHLNISQFQASIERLLQNSFESKYHHLTQFCLSVTKVEKKALYYYNFEQTQPMLKIVLALPEFVPRIRNILSKGFSYNMGAKHEFLTFESNLPFELRYMVDNHLVGGGWIELKPGTYTLRNATRKISHCQLEMDTTFKHIIQHDSNIPKWSRLAPFRIFSYDIECCGRTGHFPDALIDPVIQIAITVSVQGGKEGRQHNIIERGLDGEIDYLEPTEPAPVRKLVLVLDTCKSISGAQIICFEKEEALLLAFNQLMIESDADIITGYNIQNFDMPYLMKRANQLNILEHFSFMGRLIHEPSIMKERIFQSAQRGKQVTMETTIHGRITFDLYKHMKNNYKLSSYTLNSVSAEFLDQQKEDVHHSMISILHKGTSSDRHRLASYCLKDTVLPQQLIDKLLIMVNTMEMARVTGVPISYLFSRGQQIKVLSMMYRKCKPLGYVVPVLKHKSSIEFTGATVLDPTTGFYDEHEPIATLDFASLYPSIMQAHNLCYTTLLLPHTIAKMDPKDYEKTPRGHCFVREHKYKGILPTILKELLSARSQAKVDMKAAAKRGDIFLKNVMNGRQLALKLSANSVYGFTGAQQLPCVEIAASVTGYGRRYIDDTKSAVEKEFTIANGYENNAKVIYGDTDSVMVKFGCKTVAEAIRLGQIAEEKISSIFPPPNKLEYEKVYCPYRLMAKKRYIGRMYEFNPDKYEKIDSKGTEMVRRDNCGLVRKLYRQCVDKIFVHNDIPGAIEIVKQTISDLLQNKVDISLLIITKMLNDNYKTPQPHSILAERIRKRDPGTAPLVGDRVPFVIIKNGEKKMTNRAEDPIYVLDNNIPIDNEYYFKNQLSEPIIRLFTSIIPRPESLLHGDHTNKIVRVRPDKKVGMLKFITIKKSCLACKKTIEKGSKDYLCENCQDKRQEVYVNQLTITNKLEKSHADYQSQCHRCTGSNYNKIICANTDCDIFYARIKTAKDLGKEQKKLSLLDF